MAGETKTPEQLEAEKAAKEEARKVKAAAEAEKAAAEQAAREAEEAARAAEPPAPEPGPAGYRAVHCVKGARLYEPGQTIPAGEVSDEQAARLLEQGIIERA